MYSPVLPTFLTRREARSWPFQKSSVHDKERKTATPRRTNGEWERAMEFLDPIVSDRTSFFSLYYLDRLQFIPWLPGMTSGVSR